MVSYSNIWLLIFLFFPTLVLVLYFSIFLGQFWVVFNSRVESWGHFSILLYTKPQAVNSEEALIFDVCAPAHLSLPLMHVAPVWQPRTVQTTFPWPWALNQSWGSWSVLSFHIFIKLRNLTVEAASEYLADVGLQLCTLAGAPLFCRVLFWDPWE